MIRTLPHYHNNKNFRLKKLRGQDTKPSCYAHDENNFFQRPSPLPYYLKLIDSLQTDEVPVLICHGLKHIAPWGELLSTRARYLQSAGCLTDGTVRDVRVIREMKFPVFTGGITPVDTKYRGKLAWYDVPGKIHGVDVESGDLVFGDVDGVVIIPKKLVEPVLEKSLQKVSDENMVREKIVSGESLEKIFADHGIL